MTLAERIWVIVTLSFIACVTTATLLHITRVPGEREPHEQSFIATDTGEHRSVFIGQLSELDLPTGDHVITVPRRIPYYHECPNGTAWYGMRDADEEKL